MSQTQLILASGSPYRKELLDRLKIPFSVVVPELDEEPYKHQVADPEQLAVTLAYEKSKLVAVHYPDAVVIGSDQVVSIEGKILGKPLTKESASTQLAQLSGKSHLLITACSIRLGAVNHLIVDQTVLSMRELTPREIKAYINADNPLNCAGSYKIESLGISLFSNITSSDFTAITGLPLLKVSECLRSLGFSIP